MIIAVGFDGTCVTDDFPRLGKEIGAAEALRLLCKRGHQITLQTHRKSSLLAIAHKWFSEHGIPLIASLNYRVDPDIYINSRAIGCPLVYGDSLVPYVDWVKVIELVDLIDRRNARK